MSNKVTLVRDESIGAYIEVREVDGSPGPGKLDLTMVQGQSFRVVFLYLDSSGTAIDVGSDVTNSPNGEFMEIRMQIKDTWTSSTTIGDFDRSTKGNIVTPTIGTSGGGDGYLTIDVPSTTTSTYTFKNAVYNIEVDIEDVSATITPSTHFDVDVVYQTNFGRIQDNAAASAFSTFSGGDRIIVTSSENTNEGTYTIGRKNSDDDIIILGNLAGTDNSDDETITLQKMNDVKQMVRGKIDMIKEV